MGDPLGKRGTAPGRPGRRPRGGAAERRDLAVALEVSLTRTFCGSARHPTNPAGSQRLSAGGGAVPRRRLLAAALACVGALAAGSAGLAQDAARFGGRLSVMPVDFATRPTMSGSGRAEAVLDGRTLAVAGDFQGLSSPAAAGRLHRAPPARRGPAVFDLDVTEAAAGQVSGEVELDDAQIRALRRGEYYVQIATRDNPDGELRGWLLPRAGAE